MTAAQLLRYRHEPYRQELIAGRLYEMEPTGAEHGLVATRIGMMLDRHVEAAGLGTVLVGDVGFQLAADPDTVRAPDAAFIARDRVEAMGIPRGYWPGPPDLAVEVVSPNDRHSAVEAKALHWLAAGARAVVVVDPPRRSATVYRARDDIRVLARDEPLDLGDVVAGFAPQLGELFPLTAMPTIVTLPGDGIGPEVMGPALEVLRTVCDDLEFDELAFGGAAIDAHGTALTDEALAGCRRADAVLLAAVGGPRWDTTDPHAPRPEQGLLGLRKGLGLFANLRPIRPLPALYDASPLRRERIAGTDLLVVRELTGGIYFGARTRTATSASDLCEYSVAEVERIARVAFEAARTRRNRVASVDKANVLETSRLWREVVHRVHADEYADVELSDVLVDNAAMQLIARPADFDVIVTENLFGDILSDEAAMLTGSIGMLPSASLGDGGPGLFEPVHGSAPDIAGTGAANPLAMFLSAALMLRHGLGREAQATALESAVDRALDAGLRTRDLGGDATTEQATRTVLDNL